MPEHLRMGVLTAAVALAMACGAAGASAQEFDPAHDYRTVRTTHFAIHFHQGEEPLAVQLADIAESTWRDFDRRYASTPPAFTHVVLSDQTDLPNGYATPLPRNRIVLYAVTPSGDNFLDAGDWLRVVFVHEFAHIVHLDRARGWARIARGVFGRAPWTFPNLLLPTWQVEGLAAYHESEMTGGGRLHAGEFRAIVREDARTGRFQPIDRVSGGRVDWPGGHAAYAYGLEFHQWLAQRHGDAAFDTLATRTAGSLPWLGLLAFDDLFGAPLTELWRQFQDSAEAAAEVANAREAPAVAARRLTRHGHVVTAPRYVPASCPACAPDVLYSTRTPHDFPAIYRYDRSSGTSRHVVTRNQGAATAPFGPSIVFDQLDVERGAGLYSDLHIFDATRQDVTRITRGERLLDPDISPDGRTLAAVRNHAGRRELVTLRIDTEARAAAGPPVVLLSEPGVSFNTPSWSPDGRQIVAERQRQGAASDLVAITVGSATVQVLASSPDVQWITPTWRPDGLGVIAAASKGDGPYALYDISVADRAMRRIATMPGGATWPDVSPDGGSIVFVGYDSDGFDVYEIPYDASGEEAPAAPADELPASAAISTPAAADDGALAAVDLSGSRPYGPWHTLPPTSWSPVLAGSTDDLRAGAAIAGSDVLAYHAYQASATWPLQVPAHSTADTRVPDWAMSYTYRRWVPQFWVAAARETSFHEGPPDEAGLATPVTGIQRAVEGGIQVPFVTYRRSHALRLSWLRAIDDFSFAAGKSVRRRSAARVAWGLSSSHVFGYSISPERGVSAGATLETMRRSWGASSDVTTATIDTRAYVPGLGRHHVVAVRLAGGSAQGAGASSRVFLLGGGSPNAGTTGFDSDDMSLLRGFGDDTFAGRHVALVNIDYRWPLARPQRGLATWPVFLRAVHAAVVFDTGHAWTRTFRAGDLKTSLGVELAADVVLGYELPVTVAVGVARGHDGSGAVPDVTTGYARVGYAF